MSVLKIFKPEFLDYKATDSGPFKSLFNFSQLWRSRIFFLLCVALIPFIALAVFNYLIIKYDTEQEIHLRTARLVSNAKRTVSFFLEERKSALNFIVRSYNFKQINEYSQLTNILQSLKESIGGFTDLGIFDASGKQVRYEGPYDQEDIDYSAEDWFKEVVTRGHYISDVYFCCREIPHLVLAVKQESSDGSFYVLRATLDTDRFNRLLSQLNLIGNGDAFLINRHGTIQTPSLSHGNLADKIMLPIPEYSEHTEVLEVLNNDGKQVVIGYAYIPESPFILMLTEEKSVLMQSWRKTQKIIIFFVILTILGILIVVYGVATHLVNQVFLADLKRVHTLHEVEQSSKLASIGRLAAGVAHEINNPLAIINEKAGLIKDIFSFKEEYKHDTKIPGLIDSIISSVERCGTITKRLLGFARHLDVSVQSVNIHSIIEDVLGFLVKEAEYRSITINKDTVEDIPEFETDRGKLQQIMLNLVNNAFAAMHDNGRLDIKVRRVERDYVSVSVKDDGCGISEANLKKIFEPFFSTKTKTGGTGLGLSITYGLIQELNGKLDVTSQLGKGTTFTITLPLTNITKKE
ncbi:MAG: two-component sensor histidine kinase [Desulfobulbaceae bacterium]|nr:two-component sensor histidine kinase [Desulfobulbaceae bacterium]